MRNINCRIPGAGFQVMRTEGAFNLYTEGRPGTKNRKHYWPLGKAIEIDPGLLLRLSLQVKDLVVVSYNS